MQIIEADLTWTGGTFQPAIQIEIDTTGRITRVGSLGDPVSSRLEGQALIPGFVNAHSHAFQIGLRRRRDEFRTGTGSFWTWRDAMYDLAASLDRDAFRKLCRATFEEMLDAGITCVGEFHYLHHSSDEARFDLDPLVLEAAREAGIRVVLLHAAYATGGIGKPLTGVQTRFETPTGDPFWEQIDALGARLGDDQSLGVAAHSVRAVSIDDIGALYEEARRRELPFHVHVEEQHAEIEACVATYGERPLSILTREIGAGRGFVAVHATHADAEDLARLLDSGGGVCVCPLTEGHLGDGLPNLDPAFGDGRSLSLGSDSNARISLVEEARWLEYGQRLRSERRGALRDAAGRSGAALLDVATRSGARALGVETGAIEPGLYADLVTIDLTHPTLAGADADTLAESLIFGSGNEALTGTYVSGRWRSRR